MSQWEDLERMWERETSICKSCIESAVQRLVICVQGWEEKIQVCWRWHCPIDPQCFDTLEKCKRMKAQEVRMFQTGVYKRKRWSCKSLTCSNIPAQLCKHRHLKHSVNSFHEKNVNDVLRLTCEAEAKMLKCIFCWNVGLGGGEKVFWAKDTGGIMSSRVCHWEHTSLND